MIKELPDKPSELIMVALHDLELCEKDDNYHINMLRWHEYRYNKQKDVKICHVCLAGAVMAKSLGAASVQNAFPANYREEDAKLQALNAFRTGRVSEGLEYMGLNSPQIGDFNVIRYSESPAKFKASMRSISNTLKEHGL